jgi:hypothetical protein
LAVLADAAYSLLGISIHTSILLTLWLELHHTRTQDARAARKLQTGMVMVMSTILALTTWEIVGAIYDRQMHPGRPPHWPWSAPAVLLATLLGQAFWAHWLEKNLRGVRHTLARDVNRWQPFFTSAALLTLFLPPAWRDADCWIAGLILLALAQATIWLVYTSLNTLAES